MDENKVESKEGHPVGQPGNKEVEPFASKVEEPDSSVVKFPNNIETKENNDG